MPLLFPTHTHTHVENKYIAANEIEVRQSFLYIFAFHLLLQFFIIFAARNCSVVLVAACLLRHLLFLLLSGFHTHVYISYINIYIYTSTYI